jgi:hypothetical protein
MPPFKRQDVISTGNLNPDFKFLNLYALFHLTMKEKVDGFLNGKDNSSYNGGASKRIASNWSGKPSCISNGYPFNLSPKLAEFMTNRV